MEKGFVFQSPYPVSLVVAATGEVVLSGQMKELLVVGETFTRDRANYEVLTVDADPFKELITIGLRIQEP